MTETTTAGETRSPAPAGNRCHCIDPATWMLIARPADPATAPLRWVKDWTASTNWAACDEHLAEAARRLRDRLTPYAVVPFVLIAREERP